MSVCSGFPRVVIAGTQSGVGKTTVAAGLMAVLARRFSVQPFKVGPDYIDAAYHTFITGRKCRNLDSYMLSEDTIRYLFCRNAAKAHLAVIEGVMGLFDGLDPRSQRGSTAEVAKALKAPVILVMDGSGMAGSAAAMVRGYREFDKDLNIAGVIINKVKGEGHYRILQEAIEHGTGLKVFGYLAEEGAVELPSRHLGLVPSAEIPGLREKLGRLAEMMEKTIDIEGLIKLILSWGQAVSAPDNSLQAVAPSKSIRLAVAWDAAFNFYYWDNLDLLEDLGADLLYFSPLKDEDLPPSSQGVLLGGGFPEVFAQELEANTSMRRNIRKHLAEGMPYVAECGGLMYLAESLSPKAGTAYEMVGWLQGQSMMTGCLQRFGYAELALREDCVYGQAGLKTKVHEFHYSSFESPEEPRGYSLIRKNYEGKVKQWQCGFIKGNGIAGYPHIHYYSNVDFARNFLSKAGAYQPGLRANHLEERS